MFGKIVINSVVLLLFSSGAKSSEEIKKVKWENNKSFITSIEASKKALLKYPGKIISSLLDKKNGYSFYEINIADPKGDVQKVFVDAKNGEVFTFHVN